MGLGILEPNTTSHVAGTVLLNEKAAHSEAATHDLKHATGSNAHIILAPQPSEDPNDPLNWSFTFKHIVLAILCLGSIVDASAPGPLLTAGTVQISGELHTDFTSIALLSGYNLLTTGAGGIFVSALARKFGKRPVYVFSSLMGLIGCIIGECASDYSTLLAARIVQGLSTSAYESIIMASIGDIFFVHERGSRVATVMFILAAISNGIAIIAGTITAHLGWHYNFHILLPFVAIEFLLTFFFVPETNYRRAAIYETDLVGSNEDLSKLVDVENRTRHRQDQVTEKDTDLEHVTTTTSVGLPPPRKTFLQNMKLYNGTFVKDSIFKMIIAPVVILFNVAAAFNIFISGLIIAWYIAISVLSSVIFSAPPYGFSAAGVGYTSTGPLIGGLLGALFMGWTSDPLTRYLTRRNNGVYEPEFRIPLMAVGLVLTVAGLVGFGHAIQAHKSVYLICFLWGMTLFGMTVVAIVTTGYAMDSFRMYTTEIFIMNMVFKNFFFYGLTNYIINWYLQNGAAQVFDVMAGISAALCLTSVPMYFYGKRYRHFWQHHNLIKKFRLETDKTGAE